jgi:hypothetical protein
LVSGVLLLFALAAVRVGHAQEAPQGLLDQAQTLLTRTRDSTDPALWAQIEPLLEQIEQMTPPSPRAPVLRAWYDLSLHRFLQGRERLEGLYARGQLDAIGLGLYSDALVETGAYASAVEATQAMVDRYPGLPAFARAAHLRFLHGDLAGALALAQRASAAEGVAPAARAWMLVQLADYRSAAGDHAGARRAAQAAARDDARRAQAASARIALAQGRRSEAQARFETLLRARPDPESAFALFLLARAAGDAGARERYAAMLDGMARLDGGGLYRRLYAHYLSLRPGRAEQALLLAREEWAARPDLYSEMTLALALVHARVLQEAAEHARSALRLGTPDPQLRMQGAQVLEAAGDVRSAAGLRAAALRAQPGLVVLDGAPPGRPARTARNEP